MTCRSRTTPSAKITRSAPTQWGGGDAFLLSSDGFWEHVTETEMEADLAAAAGPAEWLRRMESRLKRTAPANHDNYAAVAVVVEG